MDQDDNHLGSFLKERRARLDPASFGLPLARRRTPGLRREEVAQLAHVSATWYTWLEQGRGGAPSADVLDRLARALALTEEEREHLFLLAQDRPPRPRYDRSAVTPYLQRVLDAFPATPAIIKTPEWTVLAWNHAAGTVLADYANIPEGERNILRMLFRADGHDHLPDWEDVARNLVGTVRRDIARAGMREETRALIEDLSASSADFRHIWAGQDVGASGEHFKRIRHPEAGLMTFEYSTFSVDGHPDLALVVFNPATDEDRAKTDRLLAGA